MTARSEDATTIESSIAESNRMATGASDSEKASITSLDEPIVPKWRFIVLSICLCFGLFLSILDTSIVATALYTIGVEFDSLNTVTWIALSYTLAYVGCAVPFSLFSDVIGRRNAYVCAFIIFFAFSLGCGFSRTMNQLIVCRALQGIGGSGLSSITLVIFPEVAPPESRKWIGSLAGIVLAMSGVLGPVLGGIITNYTTWRWIFWINAPIGILPLILFVVAWPKPHQLLQPKRRLFRELDFVGIILLIAASVLVVFSLQEGGINQNTWGTAVFIAPITVGCVCWVLLLGWEVTVAKLWEHSVASIAPLRLLKNRVYSSGALATMLMGFPYFVIIYNLPLRFQIVNQKSALLAGIGLLPMLGSSAVASMVGGMISAKKNRAFETMIMGSSLMLLGTGLLSTLSSSVEVEAKAYAFQIFVGLGFGFTASTISMLAAVESEIRDHAVAQGIISQLRILGGSIGIAASTAMLGVKQHSLLTGIVSDADLSSLRSFAQKATPAQWQAVRETYAESFTDSMRVCAIISGLCILVTLGTFRRQRMDMAANRRAQLERNKALEAKH